MGKKIDVEKLKEMFRLKDGNLERLDRRFNKEGKWVVVQNKGNAKGGYCQVKFNGKNIRYHAVIWILLTGENIPKGYTLDHINGNRVDNRIENLRLVTQRENTQNRKEHRKGKLVGCYFKKLAGRYESKINIEGKQIYLGLYATEEEAHNAYVSACEHIEEYVDNASFRELIKQDQK